MIMLGPKQFSSTRERTVAEIGAAGNGLSYDAVREDLKKRDARDSARADSPLRPAEDAHLLDTSEMDIEAAFRAAKRLIDAAYGNGTRN